MKSHGYFVDGIPRRKFLQLGLKGSMALAAAPALLRGLLAGQAPTNFRAAATASAASLP